MGTTSRTPYLFQAGEGGVLSLGGTMNAWQRILTYLKSRVNSQSYQTWLRPTRMSHASGDNLYVRVPSKEFDEWIHENYGVLIREALESLDSSFHNVVFEAPPEKKIPERDGKEPSQAKFDFDSAAHQLNPRYTFDSFVVGSCNQFARAAALAVAEQPSKNYNPLFLYGGSGLGKTHLMHAIGHMIESRCKDKRIAFVTSEGFTNEVINSLRFDRMISFRDKYRCVDVLLMDDIHFIAGKERTQEEFFHTFNALYEAQKQLVVSSDCAPKDIRQLEERLRSRISWGLTADLQPPDLETRMAILAKKAAAEGQTLPENVCYFIASKMKANVRDLEGALVRLLAFSSLTDTPLSLEMAEHVLKALVDLDERRVSIENILRVVCHEFKLSPSQLRSKTNSHAVAYPRQIAMYLAKELTPASLPQIGKEFGGKHHTTALHAIRKIAELRKTSKDIDRLIHKLMDELN